MTPKLHGSTYTYNVLTHTAIKEAGMDGIITDECSVCVGVIANTQNAH